MPKSKHRKKHYNKKKHHTRNPNDGSIYLNEYQKKQNLKLKKEANNK